MDPVQGPLTSHLFPPPRPSPRTPALGAASGACSPPSRPLRPRPSPLTPHADVKRNNSNPADQGHGYKSPAVHTRPRLFVRTLAWLDLRPVCESQGGQETPWPVWVVYVEMKLGWGGINRAQVHRSRPQRLINFCRYTTASEMTVPDLNL